VVPVWWLVVLSAITVYGLSKKWFSFGGWLYYRPLLFNVYQRSGSLSVVGYIVGIYCLRFIKEVVPVWWLVVLSAIIVYGLSKKWFPVGGWLYCRHLLFNIYQRSGSRLVVGCIIGHYCLRFIKEVVPVW
jgi:ABC-type dipeptide/oligopeptide/nickel transport system permease component